MSKRRFSKTMLALNAILAWGAVFFSISVGEGVASIVIPPALTLVAWLYAGYIGVGHLDFRRSVETPSAPARPRRRDDEDDLPREAPR
ncbi:hypothetical protein [Azospirillum argentinense]|uniref:hypothetical protein n=1 Tax=Azospirillum argentinense TaxID=2970906 RepID=UPI0032DF58A4